MVALSSLVAFLKLASPYFLPLAPNGLRYWQLGRKTAKAQKQAQKAQSPSRLVPLCSAAFLVGAISSYASVWAVTDSHAGADVGLLVMGCPTIHIYCLAGDKVAII